MRIFLWGMGTGDQGLGIVVRTMIELPSKTPIFRRPIPSPQSPILDALEYLEEAGIVRHAGDKWHWADRSFPAEGISIRSATTDNVVIIDVTGGRNTVIGEMDRPSAKELIFDNAVYIHRGRQYMVEKLDIENRKAQVREADVNYFTDGLVKTDIKVLTEDEKFFVGSRDERTLDGHESGDPQSPVLDALEYLEEAGIVRHAGDKWHWADRSFPAEGISIRSATADNVVIIDVTSGRNTVIGEMDRPSAKELIFDNAVYIHRGRQYLVEKLDIENRKAQVREADVNYFTDGLMKTDIKVLTEDEKFVMGTGDWGSGCEISGFCSEVLSLSEQQSPVPTLSPLSCPSKVCSSLALSPRSPFPTRKFSSSVKTLISVFTKPSVK
jgi:ATP-dependent helicase YprA (DUF1998 family)